MASGCTPGAKRTPRVVLVAENASLHFGGEAALPLHFFRVLRQRGVEAWLVVHERCKAAVQEAFPDELDRVVFVRDRAIHKLLFRLGRPLPSRIALMTTGLLLSVVTQWQMRRKVKSLVKRERVEVVHQPIPVSPRLPTMMSRLGIPVLIGPMNGGMDFPEAFRSYDGTITRLFVWLGRKGSNLANRLVDGKLKADALLVANKRTAENLPDGIRGEVIELVENGVDLSVWAADAAAQEPQSRTDGLPRFVYMGRLVDWKAIDLLLEAFARVVAKTPARLSIIGDGAIRPSLEAQARSLGLLHEPSSAVPEGPGVEFLGWQGQAECAKHLARADALVLPSLLECGGAVVLEAMAMSRPVVATDWGGPTDYLDPSCGILVPPASKEGFIDGLAAAMLRLAGDYALCRRMGKAGRQKVMALYTWDRKGDIIVGIYERFATRPEPARVPMTGGTTE